MSTSIVSRTISSIVDQKIACTNSQVAAVLDIGTSWTEVWVAARVALTDPGVSLPGGTGWFFGMMASPASGMTNGVLTNTCSNFAGIWNADYGFSAMTRQAGPPVYFSAFTNGVTTKHGSTTGGGAGGGTEYFSGDPTIRMPFIVQLRKPNIINRISYGNGVCGDCPLSVLKLAMEADSLTNARAYLQANVPNGASTIGNTSGTIAFNEATYGYLNAVTFGWNRATCAMEFSEIIYAKKE